MLQDNRKTVLVKTAITFVILFTTLLIIQFSFGKTRENYLGDPWEYAAIGDSLFASGHFNLLDIESPITVWGGGDYRGYVFPVLLGVCGHIDQIFGLNCTWWIVSSFIYAGLFLVYFKFIKDAGIRKTSDFSVIRNLIPFGFVLVFFYGLITNALTDMLAALLAIAAAEVLLLAIRSTGRKKYLYFFLTGMVSYLAYNIRTIYMLEVFGMVITAVISEVILLKKEDVISLVEKVKRLCSAFVLMFAGFYFAALPQVYLNYSRYNSLSPKVRVNGLFAQQLWWGIGITKYGTYVGNDGIHDVPMKFIDATGMAIQKAFESEGYEISLKTYILAFLKYPVDFISILWKHLWNALFVMFPETFIEDLTKDRSLYVILGLCIVILFIFLLYDDIKNGIKEISLSSILIVGSLLLPSIAILFGALEERFLIVLYLLIYGRVSDYQKNGKKSRQDIFSLLIKIAIGLVIAFTAISVEGGIMAGLKGIDGIVPLTFNGK